MQPALVEQEGNEQQDLLNPEKPYEVDEFFKLIAKHPGNNTWQCLGKCGKSSSGFVAQLPKERMVAHIARIPGRSVTLCTRLPTQLRGKNIPPETMREIARRIHERHEAAKHEKKRKIEEVRFNMEPQSKKPGLALALASAPMGQKEMKQQRISFGADGSLSIGEYSKDEVNDMFASS